MHQYLHRAEVDDPVTEAVLYRARLLRRLGLRAEVFATHIAAPLARAFRPAATFDSPEAPLIFQAIALPAGPLPLPARRVVLTSSALWGDADAAARLRAWIGALGPRVAGVISELPPAQSASAWRLSPPLFDGGRLSRRSPLLPAIPIGRWLVLAPSSAAAWAREIVDAAASQLKREIDLQLLDETSNDRPPAELAGLLRRADALLWGDTTEPIIHPLLALAFDLPVLAADSDRSRQLFATNVVQDGSLAATAAALTELLSDPQGRRPLQREQREALEEQATETLATLAADLGLRPRRVSLAVGTPPRIVIEGSFETSYSLDILNRGLARALERAVPGQVALRPSNGHGDYLPKQADLDALPDLEKLWRGSHRHVRPEVLLRGMYPPRVADMRGGRNLLYFAWEESNVPAAWVAEFNRRLDGLVVLSAFVKKVLIDAGVRIPVWVIGCGIDQVLETPSEPFPGPLGKGFKFLHVSSAFPRKGIDVLLRAFAAAFSDRDDVSLVIKTFPNEHHQIERDLAALLRDTPGAPKIVLINRDLPPGQLRDLYDRCDALVAPSRGEGFGLPMAEAMALGLPVITTGHGGVLDFAEPGSTWLVDFTFAQTQSHLGLSDSVWAEPSVESLVQALREVAALSPKARRQATTRAKAIVTQGHTWDRVAARFTAALEALEQPRPPRTPLRVGWVSPWNTDGELPATSAALIAQLPPLAAQLQVFANHEANARDEPSVTRCWTSGTDDLAELEAALLTAGRELTVLHFDVERFAVAAFGKLLRRLRERSIGRVIVLHARRADLAPIAPELGQAERLLVHSVDDLNALKQLGLVANVALFPRGASDAPPGSPHAWDTVATRLWGLVEALRPPG